MPTPTPTSPDEPPSTFPWEGVCLFTVWFGLPLVIASMFLVEEVEFVREAWYAVTGIGEYVRAWLEDAVGVPNSATAFMGEGFAFLGISMFIILLLGVRLRRHPRITAKHLRVFFVLLIAVIAFGWRAEREERASYAEENRHWLEPIYPEEIRHFMELAEQLGNHGYLLFLVWAAATALAATYAFDWRAIIQLAEQRFDGGRRLRLLQTLTQNTPLPIAGIYSALACAGIPLALALLFMSAPKNLLWETHLDVPFAIGSLPANNPHPVLPLAIQADGTVRLDDFSHTIHSAERLPALREFVQARQIDSKQMKVTLRIAPESTLQQMISVIDDLKRVGFHGVVFLD